MVYQYNFCFYRIVYRASVIIMFMAKRIPSLLLLMTKSSPRQARRNTKGIMAGLFIVVLLGIIDRWIYDIPLDWTWSNELAFMFGLCFLIGLIIGVMSHIGWPEVFDAEEEEEE